MASDPAGPGATGTMAAGAHAAASQMLTAPSEAQRSQALQRWRMLQPTSRTRYRWPGRPSMLACRRTARRWRTRYRAEGLVGLARPARTDRGRRRFSADLVAFIADTFHNDAWSSFRRMPC